MYYSFRKRFFLLVWIFFYFFNVASAQQTLVTGTIFDSSNQEKLPAATISIEGTYTGTISNSEGEFSLSIKQFPATLMIRFIGYETQKVSLNSQPKAPLKILMKPIAYEMASVEITGEDPAVYVMRQVIEKKKVWQKNLISYRADAYTRQRLENETGIVSINESISTAYWHYKLGSREVIKSKRQTENMNAAQNFAGASYIPNFYDDNIEISGFKMVGITNPDAISTYSFKMEGYRKLDDKVVFDISVKPKSKLATAFIGKISVLDEDYALLEVDLVPSESMMFPPPIKEFRLHYKQQFNNFGGDFWLPVDVRISGSISIAMMGLAIPKINVEQISRLSDYDVNIPLPDSLYEFKRMFIVDSLSVAQKSDSLFSKEATLIPLSEDESKAYSEIDSTLTLEKAFKPTGFLTKFLDVETDSNNKTRNKSALDKTFDYFTPELWYNRVESAHFGGDVHYSIKNVEFGVRGGYKTGLKGWGYGSYIKFQPKKSRFKAKIFFNDDSELRNKSENYARILSSGTMILTGRDYFDYYWSKQTGVELEYRFILNAQKRRRERLDLSLNLQFLNDESRSLNKITDYDILAIKRVERPNPIVFNGTIRSLKSSIQIGDDYIPFAPIGQSRVKISVEHSNKSILSSALNFTTYRLEADYRLNTFFQRRFLPNTFDVHIEAGTSSGALPLQRMLSLDGNLGGFTPFGTFRSLPTRFYEGEQVLALHWEHNFRTVPFELLGLRKIAEKGTSLILFGSHGKTWMSQRNQALLAGNAFITNGIHHELGASLSGIFDFLRIDFVQRIDRPNFYIGISVARML